MADTVMDDLKIAKLLNQQKMDINYTKYENIKLAAQKRRSASETNKSRNQKILVTPLRAFCPMNGQSVLPQKPVDIQLFSDRKSVCPEKREALISRRCKSETKELHRRPSPSLELGIDEVKDVLKNDKDVKIVKVVRKHSPIPFKDSKRGSIENADKNLKTKDIKKSESPLPLNRNEVKARCPSPSLDVLKTGERYRRPPSPKVDKASIKSDHELSNINMADKLNGISEIKHPETRHQKDVRRKLDFDNEDADPVADLPKGLDFTDKIAALRSLISRDRIEKAITDRKAYYNEYHSSRRKVMVSRNDSLKENHDNDNTNNNAELTESLKEKPQVRKHSRAQSADVLKSSNEHKQFNELDLQQLKERLEAKQRKQELKKELKRSDENDDREVGDLLHASSGRRILESSRKNRRNINIEETSESDSRPDSRLESKETQTNVLNQSIRSVQSNVPYYDIQRGRPCSAPVFNCDTVVGQRKVYRQREGVSEGKEKGQRVRSVKKRSSNEDRQSNVGDIVEKSLTPEKKVQHGHDIESNEVDIEKGNKFTKGKQYTENDKLKNDTGNHRPSSRCSQTGPDDEVRHIWSSSRKSEKVYQTSRSSSAVNVDMVRRQGDLFMDQCASKSERKVREWIKKQEILNKGRPKSANFSSRPFMMEELSVSISIPTDENVDMKHSPADSCDRIPVKLEKQKDEKSYTLGLGTPGANGYLESKNENPDFLSNRQAIFDRLEQITMAVSTRQHKFEVDIPVKALQKKTGPDLRDAEIPAEQSDSADTE